MTYNAPTSPYALVVDDDFVVRMDTIDILEQAGFEVLEADHGDAAHELLETRHPDIVLLFTDVQMPGTLDGFALARKVAHSWPHISLVVASGNVGPSPGALPDKARFMPSRSAPKWSMLIFKRSCRMVTSQNHFGDRGSKDCSSQPTVAELVSF